MGSCEKSLDMRWVVVGSGGWEREMAEKWCLVVFLAG